MPRVSMQILVRDRQAVQRPEFFAARLHLIGLGGGVGSHLRHQGHDGVDLGVHALDLLQVHGQRFARGEFLRADQARHLDRARET